MLSKKILTEKQILKVCEKLNKSIENPKIELNYINDYTLLIAVILSARSTDIGVNKATKNLFAIVDSPQKMLELGRDTLISYVKTIGLYPTKTKNIMIMSQQLINDFNSKVPDNMDDLQKLAGVGRKSANVILNCLFNHNTIAVDTHVFRTGNRIGLCAAKNVTTTEKQLMQNIPTKWHNKMHHLLVLHGRYVCKAIKPKCEQCVLNDICLCYNEKQ